MRSDFWLLKRREKERELEKGSQKYKLPVIREISTKEIKQHDKYNQ